MKFRGLLVALMALVFGSACSAVPAGHVGILVDKYGGTKGVQQQVVNPGYLWVGFNEELFVFPTFQQNRVFTASPHEGQPHDESFTFQSIDGMSINADVGISYHLVNEKISMIFQKYREGIDEITETQVRNVIRDALNSVSSTMSVTDLYGPRKEYFLQNVKAKVSSDPTLDGIVVDNIYLVGTMRLPETIVAALNSKIEATQKAQQRQNEVAEAQAAALKEIATAEGHAKAKLVEAQSEAQANKLKLQTLTPELIRYEAIRRWNGTLPTMMSGNAVPFISLNEK